MKRRRRDLTRRRERALRVGTGAHAAYTAGKLDGGLVASVFAIHPFTGAQFLLKGFAVALVGGLGNIEGAVAAALIIGFTETLGAGYLATEWRDAYTFGLMIIILLWRPTGLFRARGRLQETLQ